ncbi:MAG TPA: hypothetical protein VFV11_09475, partial [Solimonas sp.]|nr:hypothetical protein [Solimonas sp.]
MWQKHSLWWKSTPDEHYSRDERFTLTPMRLILITLLCLVTTACVGVGVIVPGERRFPELSPGTVRTPPSTREQVTTRPENRGRQPVVRHEGPLETWAYDRGASWCGALFVVVPLMLPVC